MPLLRPLRYLQLLHCGFLRRYVHLELVEEGIDLRLPQLDEPDVVLHLRLIPDGIHDGLLLRHLLGLGDSELRLRLRHVQARSMDLRFVVLLRLVLLHGLRHLLLQLLLLLLILFLHFRRVRRKTHTNVGGA
ncbi:hypothetical protein D1007_47951 [Hordeum vulgare]|nr:hypothetical protein D1007_47951 [Hordeum vulgare]